MAKHWLSQLDGHLGARRVAEGFQLLNQHLATIQAITAIRAGWLLGYRAACGMGGSGLSPRRAAGRPNCFVFNRISRRPVATREFLELRMAEGFSAMNAEDLDRSISLLDFVLQAEDELGDQSSAAIAHFWKGRVASQEGRVRRGHAARPPRARDRCKRFASNDLRR